MEKFSYSSKIFNLHFKHFKEAQNVSGFTLLELGPGDSLMTALFGYALGARRTYLVDVGNFASKDLSFYSEAFDQLVESQSVNVTKPNFGSFETMLQSINAVYLCEGVESLKEIESDCVDFMFSHSVLEHVRLADLQEVLVQLFRVSKAGSTASHNIDYMDHLGGGQNHLRFSKKAVGVKFFCQIWLLYKQNSCRFNAQKIF